MDADVGWDRSWLQLSAELGAELCEEESNNLEQRRESELFDCSVLMHNPVFIHSPPAVNSEG